MIAISSSGAGLFFAPRSSRWRRTAQRAARSIPPDQESGVRFVRYHTRTNWHTQAVSAFLDGDFFAE
ncbi:MAG: hypothetical protein IPH06_13785 [Alphaproteobacteria bacterium]|nr:hypothetical protein [Alphaproteobacteria bacterium]